tara:strand:+ start:105 stop:1298 length:1194 start_codon:yes stop_codon:yes gene_type:complete
MKILVIFADMLRANRLSTFSDSVTADTELDRCFRTLGGRAYQNCFTPGPDTARGIASFTSGLDPHANGCDIRLKWPRYFLKPDLKTVYDLFLENGYKIDMLSDPRERATGLFPAHISGMDVHSPQKYDIDKYLNDLVLEEKHFIFLSLPQFHWTLDVYGSSSNGEKHALKDVAYAFDKVFSKLDKDSFDHIFVFSDHGFKFAHEVKFDPEFMLLNEDRINTVLLHRRKYDSDLSFTKKLCSLSDLYPTFEEILSYENRGFSLFAKMIREYVVIEDHIKFLPEVNQNIELWAVATESKLYIRSLTDARTIDRKSRNVTEGSVDYFDEILTEESSYKKYKDEYEKIFVYGVKLLNSVGDDYGKLYDFRRSKRSPLISGYFKVQDLIFRLLKGLLRSKKA